MINTKGLTVFKDQRVMSGDISEMQGIGKIDERLPIRVQSHKTNAITEWELVNVLTDNEGDVQCWQFSPTVRTIGNTPALHGWMLEIFND